MTLIADILMIAGALGAAFYCMVLSRRLRRFSDLEKGVGGAVAVLSMQVDDMTKTLQKAQTSAAASSERLTALAERAEDAARRLELMIASLHDLPIDAQQTRAETKVETKRPAAKPELRATRASSPTPPDSTEASNDIAEPQLTIFSSRRAPAREALA